MDKKELVNKISYLVSKKNHDQAYAIIREFEKKNNFERMVKESGKNQSRRGKSTQGSDRSEYARGRAKNTQGKKRKKK